MSLASNLQNTKVLPAILAESAVLQRSKTQNLRCSEIFNSMLYIQLRNDVLQEGNFISYHIAEYGTAESNDSEIVKPIPDRQVYYSSDCAQIWCTGTL